MEKNIVIYEQFSHFIPTGNGWADGFTDLNYNVKKVSSLQTSLYELATNAMKIDAIILFGNEYVVVDAIKLLKKEKNCKIICVVFGIEETFIELSGIVDLWCEHVYKHDLIKSIYDDNKMPFELVPLASNATIFNKIETEKSYDFSFIGQFSHGDRDEHVYLAPLLDTNYTRFCSGFSYKGQKHPHVNYNSINEIYNKTKINVNFHYPNQKIQSNFMITDYIEFNGRTFDIAMSGNFQLCDHYDIVEYFGEGIVYANKTDWVDTFEYYLKNEDVRNALETKSRENAVANHSWKNRMQIVEKYL